MANTKKLSGPERKRAKRAARRQLHELRAGLSLKERKELRKAGKGIKAFLSEKAQKKEGQ